MNTGMPPLRKVCLQHLEGLRNSVDDLRMAVVSSADGFPIAMLDVEAHDGRKAAAMAAALDGLCKSMTKEFALGTLAGTSLECELGLVLCRQVRGSKRNLVVLMVVGQKVTYGHALWMIKNTAQNIETSLEGLLEQDANQPLPVKD